MWEANPESLDGTSREMDATLVGGKTKGPLLEAQ